MGYDVAAIRKRITENKNADVLSRAKLHQMRIKFHTVKRVTSFNSPYISIPLTQFLAMAEKYLAARQIRFIQGPFPLPYQDERNYRGLFRQVEPDF